MKGRFFSPRAVAVAVACLGFLTLWIAGGGDPCSDSPRGSQEGSSYARTINLWPPGTQKCTFTAPDGSQADERIVPWLEWTLIGVLAILAGVATWLVQRLPRRMVLALLAAGSVALVIGYWIVVIRP